MKSYTSDEVINIVDNWLSNDINLPEHGIQTEAFKYWLKDKEQSELPVKDQLPVRGQTIWIRNTNSISNRWFTAVFDRFDEDTGKPRCYTGARQGNAGNTLRWDEYSLTDPNK